MARRLNLKRARYYAPHAESSLLRGPKRLSKRHVSLPEWKERVLKLKRPPMLGYTKQGRQIAYVGIGPKH